MNIEIPEMEMDLEEENLSNREKMKNVSRLLKDMDSLEQDNRRSVESFSKNIVYRMGAFVPIAPRDTSLTRKIQERKKDSLALIVASQDSLAMIVASQDTANVSQTEGDTAAVAQSDNPV